MDTRQPTRNGRLNILLQESNSVALARAGVGGREGGGGVRGVSGELKCSSFHRTDDSRAYSDFSLHFIHRIFLRHLEPFARNLMTGAFQLYES